MRKSRCSRTLPGACRTKKFDTRGVHLALAGHGHLQPQKEKRRRRQFTEVIFNIDSVQLFVGKDSMLRVVQPTNYVRSEENIL